VYPHWIDYSLAIATLLVGRGTPVDFWWLGHMTPIAERPRPVREAFWKRQARRQSGGERNTRLTLRNLDGTRPGGNNRHDADLRVAAGANRCQLSFAEGTDRSGNLERDKAIFAERVRTKSRCDTPSGSGLQSQPYAHVPAWNGGILEFGAGLQVFPVDRRSDHDLRECRYQNRIWVSHGASVVRADTSGLWHADEPHRLTPERREKDAALHTGTSESESSTWSYRIRGQRLHQPNSIRQLLDYPMNCQPYWSVRMFRSMPCFTRVGDRSFLICGPGWSKPAKYLKDRPGCQVVIRSHPAEPYYHTKETAAALLAEHVGLLPGHIKLVTPTDRISTYSIMEVANWGWFLHPPPGWKWRFARVPVVLRGNPSQHYNGKGFTLEPGIGMNISRPSTPSSKIPKRAALNERQMELAYCYADIYFHQWYRRFPYQAQSLWEDLRAWPPQAGVSPEGEQVFGGGLDELAGKSKITTSLNVS